MRSPGNSAKIIRIKADRAGTPENGRAWRGERTAEWMKAALILENGDIYLGRSIGSTKTRVFEMVFNTSMTGYQEILTDPSYAGQGIVMSYPLMGN